MINIQNYRRDVNDRRYTPSSLGVSMGTFNSTTGATLAEMIQYELGYGGRVESIDLEHQELSRIVVKTAVMSKIDRDETIEQQRQRMP